MKYFLQDKIILMSGFFSLGLYALVSFSINILSSESPAYFYISILLFLLYFNYFFLWRYFNDRELSEKSLRKVLIFSVLFTLTLVFLVPKSGGDFYHYIFEDAVLVSYQQNPYLVAPVDLPQEPLSWLSNWRNLPSQHGPFKFFLTQPAYYISQGLVVPAVFLYKLLYAFFFIASIFLVYKILKYLSRPWTNFALMLFAWNPLIVLAPHISGGNDILLLFWMLLAVYMAVTNRFHLATIFLTLSILVKYVTIIFLPIFLVYYLFQETSFISKLTSLGRHLLIFSATSLLLFLPFWQGPEIFAGTLWVGKYFSANSVPGFLYMSLVSSGIYFSESLFKSIFEGLFVVILGFLSLRLLTSKTIFADKFLIYLVLVMSLFLLIGKFWIFYKYFVWLIPLVYLLEKKYFSWGVFLTGLVVLGEIYLGYIVILLIPPVIIFAFYYILKPKLKISHI